MRTTLDVCQLVESKISKANTVKHCSTSVAEELRQILLGIFPRSSPLRKSLRRKKEKNSHRNTAVFGKTKITRGETCSNTQFRNAVQTMTSPTIISPESLVVTSVEHAGCDNLLHYVRNLCDKGKLSDAVQAVYQSNQKDDQIEDSLCSLLQHCATNKDLEMGRELHSFITRKGLQTNSYIAFHLIRMFAVCSSLLEVQQIFSGLLKPDAFLWTAMISAHANLGHGLEAIMHYEQMLQSDIWPGSHVFVAVLKACSSTESLYHGMMIHSDVITYGFEVDPFVGTMLIGMYSSGGALIEARKVFDRIPNGCDVAYNAMMTVYKTYGNNVEVLHVFSLMLSTGIELHNVVPLVCVANACSNLEAIVDGKLTHCLIIETGAELNMYVGSALIDMYMKCGCFDEACNVFGRLPEKSDVTWSSMVAAFSEVNDFQLALEYFEGMQSAGIKPNSITFISILSACSHSGMLWEGLGLFNSMWGTSIVPLVDHYNCVVDVLGRAGYLIEAVDLLHTMPFKPDIVGCMALLSHCKTHGNIEVGRTCFHYAVEMDLGEASSFTLMSEIFSHAGMRIDSEKVKAWRRNARAFKKPGEASILVNMQLHTFVAGERSLERSDVSAKLAIIAIKLREHGYFPCLD